ncbi:MAG: uracil-DNA glycosylase [Verrucomicrobia bacterium]|nr:uracil-DNA glycosylase [Verrucomicrobiota bacterium]
MKTDWDVLVEGFLGHLEELKEQGVRFLPVAPQTLAALEALSSKARPLPPPSRTRIDPAPALLLTPEKAQAAVARIEGSPVAPLVPGAANLSAVDQHTRAAAMAELRGRALVCRKCPHLAQSRKNVVFGIGDIHSPLMFVGEAPGADEDAQGEPFVGAAGQLLTRMIRAMGFSRETVYIANILKCRPDTPGQSFGNRKPTAEEMKTCAPYLLEQIGLIQPKVIVALGATAVEGLLGRREGISRLRGHFQDFRGTPVMPTYHPSYLLRSESLAVKRQVWEDMLQVLEKLNVPITEKQRNYFLKASA